MGQVQVTFRDIKPTASVTEHVERRANKLDTFFDRIIKCHVVVEAPPRHSKNGAGYHVTVDMVVPGKELVVTRNLDHSFGLHAAVDDAFGDAERVLEDYARVLKEPKASPKHSVGEIVTVFRERGYGFVRAFDGTEIYFHANSVRGGRFEKLEVGARVRYVEEDGDKGPQASAIEILDH